MTRPSRLATLAAVLVAAVSVAGGPATPAQAAELAPGVNQATYFNDPTRPAHKYPTHPNRDNVIHAVIERDIAAAPAGAVIRISTWRWTLPESTNKVKAAVDRGVDVRIALNSASEVYDETKRLKSLLGTRVTLCGKGFGENSNGACTSTRSGGTQHAKLMTISKTGDGPDANTEPDTSVVYVTSSNMDWGQINGSFNDMTRTSGDANCYARVTRYLNDAVTQSRRGTNYRGTSEGHFGCPASAQRWWVGPEAADDGSMDEQYRTDSLAKAMTPVVGGPGCYGRILWSKADDKRTPVTNQAINHKRKGCFVSGLTRMDPERADALRAAFSSAGIPWKTQVPGEGGISRHVHSKAYVLRDPAGVSRVYSGSEHPAKNDHRRNDEVVVESTAPVTVDAFDGWARHLYGRAGVPVG